MDTTTLCCIKRSLEVAKFLIDQGANINAKNALCGEKPIDVARRIGHSVIAELLSSCEQSSCIIQPPRSHTGQQHVNVSDQPASGIHNLSLKASAYASLHSAAMDGELETVKYLVSKGAGVNNTDEDGWTPLHYAAHEGQLEITKFLLEKGANIHAKDTTPNGQKPIHVAAIGGHKNVIELFLSNGVSVNDNDKDCWTPLHYAAWKGQLQAAKFLIGKGADINAQGADGKKPIHVAAIGGHKNVIEFFFSNGVSVNDNDKDGWTPLHYAAWKDQLEAAKFLIGKEANIHAKDNNGKKSIHLAVIEGHKNVIEFFLSKGISIDDTSTGDGWTPLHYAAWKGQLEATKFLIGKGANIHAKDNNGKKSIHLAIIEGHKNVIEFFLGKGISVDDTSTGNGWTPLHYATLVGQLEIVKFLIEKGSNINAQDSNGKKPIHVAAIEGHKDVIEYFFDQGLNVNIPGERNFTPLHYAAFVGQLEVIKLLIEKGANIYVKDDYGRKPIDVAREKGHSEIVKIISSTSVDDPKEEIQTSKYQDVQVGEKPTVEEFFSVIKSGDCNIVKFLVNRGADINAENIHGSKPIHVAAQEGHKNVMEFFLSKGVSIDDTDKYNRTPIHYAAWYDQLEIVEFLLDRGANINARDNTTDGRKPIHAAARGGHKNIIEFFLSRGVSIDDTDKDGRTPLHCAALQGHLDVAKFLLDKGANVNTKDAFGEKPIDLARAGRYLSANHQSLMELLSSYQHSHTQQNIESDYVIQSAHSHKEQQKAFSRLFRLTSRYHNDTDIKQVEQGLYLSAFKKRNVKVNGKCSSITRAFSQILFLGLDVSKSDLHELFLHNLKTSAELYERIAQGKQISKREEREVFAFSKLLDTFEQQLDSPTSSLPSSLSHIKSYKTLTDLSTYVTGLSGDFALHLVTSNHVVAIYRIGDNYAYFDTNVAFVSGITSVQQLMRVLEKAVEFSGYEVEQEGFLVEHFDVGQANQLLSAKQKETLTKPIQAERQLLAEQDKELGHINLNGKQAPRTILYDIGVKLYLDGASMLINAEIDSRNLAQNIHEGKMRISANEYLQTLKNSSDQTSKEAVQVAQVIPFEGSCNEIKHAQQITNSIEKSQNNQKEKLPKFLAVLLGKLNKEPTDLLSDNPATCLNDVLVNNKFEYRSVHRM